MKIITIITYFALIILSLPAIGSVQAQVGTGQINVTLTQPTGYGIKADGSAEGLVSVITKNVIFLFFTVGGLATIVYFIWGTVDWILAGGDKEKISSARKKMTNALIGVALLALSFMIIRTVGEIIGFNPLGNLQIRGLGNPNDFVPNN